MKVINNYAFIKFKIFSYLLVTCFITFSQGSYAQQISIDDSIPLNNLIETYLIQGCVEVSNIQSNSNGSVNSLASYGYFEKASSNFPFENGIMLSTGAATSAGNTVNANPLNEGETSWGTDSDLETALGISNTLNATSIEFDFISVSNQVQFNYILASEEYYANYPCDYSDGFAFLIKQTGSTDPYQNVALVPGTNIPVNTNTVHEEIVGFCPAENEEYFDGHNLGDTNFNGRTTVLSATATIQPNVQYHIKLVIADQSDENFDSAVFIEGNSFNASVDLGPDVITCADNVLLNADTQNPLATYEWFLDGQSLTGENSETLTAVTSGTYTIVVNIPISNTTCVIEDSIEVTLNSEQPAGPISDYEICDDASNDGIETFNLSSKDAEVLASVPASNYNISYHYSSNDAQNNLNPITGSIQNSTTPQIIFVRILDINNGCMAYASFNLVVNPMPVITDPQPLEVCDDGTADGFTQIDLTQANDEITNSNPNLIVSYHYSQADADTGSNPIASPYVNTNQTEQLFIRVTDAVTGCLNTTSIVITVLDSPVINMEPQTINACEQDGDGFDSFDLSIVIDTILDGLTGVSTTFHTSYVDAQTGDNPITDIENFQNTTPNVQTVYIRVVDDVTGCVSISSVDLHTNILESGTNIRNFFICDDATNDGIANFNLENAGNTIINNLENVTVTFYETEEDQTNEINPIDQSIPYEVTASPHQLFVTIESLDCTYFTDINLIINPAVLIQPLDSVDYCDTDDDGFTAIELASFDTYISTGIPNPLVRYFLNETDADNNENSLPPFYTNISNPQTVYIRVSNSSTGCHDISPLVINVIPAPTVTQPTDVVICDDNQDAFSVIDLDAKISEIVASTANLNITFHTSENDANADSNAIGNTSAYNTNTQTVYVRIESEITTCYAIVSFEVIVNTEPVFPDISNFRNCETDGNQTAEFFFVDKDSEILNGQTGKRALYFETAEDAINRTNVIDKTVAYTNQSNPQTIHVRVENFSDQSCYGVSSFIIEVGSIPLFDAPLDTYLCDDMSNNGEESFNLNAIIAEMSENSPEALIITFYENLVDAENEENQLPLDYTNQTNPQQIYARVENGTYCHAIAEFGLNVIQVPLVNSASALTQCDTDQDGSASFDLTVSESEVLDIRQNDILVTYHETIEDVENNNITIPNPNAYSNTSNPQTVYIRVTNTVSNCYVTIPLDLIVNLPPTINSTTIETCDNDDNSFSLLDTVEDLIGTQTPINLTFYASLIDAQNTQNPLDTDYTYLTNNDTIFVNALNTDTNCAAVASFNLLVNPSPIANQPPNLIACDDDFDSMLFFDLAQQTSIVLGTQDPTQFTVSYFELAEEAMDNTNHIIDLNYNAYDQQTLYVRIENNTTGCFSTTSFNTIVNRKPEVNIPDQTVCLDNLPLVVSAETGFADDTYLWSTSTSSPEIEITNIGTYSVTVTSVNGCQTTSTFNVIESEQATIEFTETVDFSNPNNITVTISGIGNYLYTLDHGVPQESNVFYNVTLGPHTIEIIDLNGCASAIKDIVIIDAPLFFTPNNDGYNDTWHITGVNQLEGTIIYIYDRYGKLIKTLNHSSPGWDGTYRGKNMPSNDYWFVALVKKDDISFEVKRHFALKR
ncbi:T9SS type B sorting domain-containing protein [Xanthomarina sp. F2636L]|uniref:T9SS type B sorting domain-containing protein n=1 Tax=Xanthomarina sp. F2636L TaxID=2996018 RepID=UPI00225DF28B|nr:choice-of-anchor L domain-containing protein [Xanthomarina sp. F2636L]MCX7549963.1 choice-of-anchor L domain-containing protein [Xanthomarina sp. F2636L]